MFCRNIEASSTFILGHANDGYTLFVYFPCFLSHVFLSLFFNYVRKTWVGFQMTGEYGSLRMSSVFVFFTGRIVWFLLCHLGRDPDDRRTGMS